MSDTLKETNFSLCRNYRYTLWREWGDLVRAKQEGYYLMVIGLNPSTADERVNDPTIRRCMGFAREWGFTGLLMTNLFAFRATDPAVMKAAADPVGEENNKWLMMAAGSLDCGMILAAWGAHGSHLGRAEKVTRAIAGLQCLKKNADGSPMHPLYVPGDTVPIPFP